MGHPIYVEPRGVALAVMPRKSTARFCAIWVSDNMAWDATAQSSDWPDRETNPRLHAIGDRLEVNSSCDKHRLIQINYRWYDCPPVLFCFQADPKLYSCEAWN